MKKSFYAAKEFDMLGLYRFASREGFLNKLKELEEAGKDPEIINYARGLDEEYLGPVIGAIIKGKIVKNKENRRIEYPISLELLKELVESKKRSKQLQELNLSEIELELPSDLDPGIKNWAIIQIKKGKKELLLKNLSDIESFVRDYGINLASYELEGIIEEIARVKGKEYSDEVDAFLKKGLELAEEKFKVINNPELIKWARKKLLIIRKEWEDKIKSSINDKNTFLDLLNEAQKIKEDMKNGLYRGKELPHTPLRHHEYDSLMSNIEFLDDWHKAISPDLSSKSIKDAVQESNKWHKDVASSGLGLQYTPINRDDIVYGPDNWQNPENEGHIILELKNENDLKVEGSKQNHCVGGYGKRIKEKECRIFSLRNVNDIYNPILTIETDMSGAIVRQDYGHGNKKMQKKYHDMVDEWSGKNTFEISKLNEYDKIRLAIKTIDPKILDHLAKDPNLKVKRAVVNNKNISEKTLNEFINHSKPAVRELVIYSPSIDNSIIRQFSKDNDEHIRLALVRALNIQDDNDLNTLLELFNDPNEEVKREAKQRVASNSLVTVDILAELIKDRNKDVRDAALANEKVDESVLNKVIKDIPESILYLIGHRSFPKDIIGEIVKSPVEYIKKSFPKELTAPEVADKLARVLMGTIFEQKVNLPSEFEKKLIKDKSNKSEKKRRSLASKSKNEETLLELASDPSIEVRMLLARRRGLPESVQKILIQDKSNDNIDIRSSVAENVGDEDVLKELLSNPEMSAKEEQALIYNLGLVEDAALSKILIQNKSDRNIEIRKHVASESWDKDVLLELADDSNDEIAQQAKKRLERLKRDQNKIAKILKIVNKFASNVQKIIK